MASPFHNPDSQSENLPMLYEVVITTRTAGDRTGPVVQLKHSAGQAAAEIWTANGFNCLSWKVNSNGIMHDLLYAMPDWESNPVPSRSGIPILFPFPNRIRDGKYTFHGKEYQLPLNDSTKQNAIHGYAPRYPWRIVDSGTNEMGAWVTGQFRPSLDAPEVLDLWPTDYALNVTYRLGYNSLRCETRVLNAGNAPLPFGLGFHPYFRFPLCGPEEDISKYRLQMPARSLWVLQESLPTGEKRPIQAELDWSRLRSIGLIQLDTLYGDLDTISTPTNELLLRAQLRHEDYPGKMQLFATKEFREMVLFTPAHRKAVCIEPYTCPTDAIHLQERGIDAGWLEIAPGSEWNGAFELRWDEQATVVLR